MKLGRNKVKVIAASRGASPVKGTLCITVTYADEKHKEITGQFWLSENAFERSIKTLIDVFDFDGDLTNFDQFLGKVCYIDVGNEEYNGNVTKKVKFVNKYTEYTETTVDPFEELSKKALEMFPVELGCNPSKTNTSIPF